MLRGVEQEDETRKLMDTPEERELWYYGGPVNRGGKSRFQS